MSRDIAGDYPGFPSSEDLTSSSQLTFQTRIFDSLRQAVNDASMLYLLTRQYNDDVEELENIWNVYCKVKTLYEDLMLSFDL